MELTFISSPPGEFSEEEALDAYSLAVTTVAERLSPVGWQPPCLTTRPRRPAFLTEAAAAS